MVDTYIEINAENGVAEVVLTPIDPSKTDIVIGVPNTINVSYDSTPASEGVIPEQIPDASITTKGLIKVATQQAVTEGLNDIDAVVPSTLKTELDKKLAVAARLAEFDTAQKKYDARENLELNIIDGGTFN